MKYTAFEQGEFIGIFEIEEEVVHETIDHWARRC
ncbi:MAG: hypothetical protein ACJAS3_000483 [Roseivirga sp.]|jgi:hypothetical protein